MPEKLKRYEFELADLKGIGQKFGTTQQQFGDFLMISIPILQKWEQGECDPDGAYHNLLRLMKIEPEAVKLAVYGRMCKPCLRYGHSCCCLQSIQSGAASDIR